MAEYIIQEKIGSKETRRTMTDDEICERLAHQVIFTANGKAIADGETPFTIHLQISSLPLADDTRRPIHKVCDVPIIVDGEAFTVATDEHGHATFECAFAAAGQYAVTTDGAIGCIPLTIEAV